MPVDFELCAVEWDEGSVLRQPHYLAVPEKSRAGDSVRRIE